MSLRRQVWLGGRYAEEEEIDHWSDNAEKDQVAPEVSSESPDTSSDARAD
jgi:hypothetical protein